MSKGILSESKSYNKVEHAKKGTVATMTEEIKLNGNNLNYNLLSYQNKIGYVPQSVYLADETILFNITLDDEKNLDEKKLSKILSLVKLNDFVEKLPNRLNTVIGERGASAAEHGGAAPYANRGTLEVPGAERHSTELGLCWR